MIQSTYLAGMMGSGNSCLKYLYSNASAAVGLLVGSMDSKASDNSKAPGDSNLIHYEFFIMFDDQFTNTYDSNDSRNFDT